jgi:hypothetical protein
MTKAIAVFENQDKSTTVYYHMGTITFADKIKIWFAYGEIPKSNFITFDSSGVPAIEKPDLSFMFSSPIPKQLKEDFNLIY